MTIHLIWGDDFGASDIEIQKLTKSLINEAWSTVNLSSFNGQDIAQANKALEEVRTPPFGEGGRVVIVKRSPFCNGCSNELSTLFQSTIPLIPKETHLILHNQNKPDARLKSTKSLQKLIKTNEVIEKSFLLPAIWDEIGQKKLVETAANSLNVEIEEEAIFSLIEAIGNDSSRLISEIKKLMLFEEYKSQKDSSHKRIVIRKETVHQLIQGVSTNSIQIGNHLLNGDFGEAIYKIDALIDAGEPALRIIASLNSQLRGWLWVSLLDQGEQKDVAYVAKQAGIANPKRIYVIRKQIQGKSPSFFLNLLKRSLEIETFLKKGALAKNAFRDGLLTKC